MLESFECGERSLDLWLKTRALANETTGASRTFVTFSTVTGECAGYFSLASHSVDHDDLKAKLRRNMPAPVPAILLGRLVVSKPYQEHGLGQSFLYEAVRISQQVAQYTGAAVLVVHPISEKATRFNRKLGFSEAKTEKTMLFLK